MPVATTGPGRPSRWSRNAFVVAGMIASPFGCRPATVGDADGALLAWTARSPANASPLGDPRADPSAFDAARAHLATARNWAEGYADLVRLGSGDWNAPPVPPTKIRPAEGDALLADLLGATIVDAQEELSRTLIPLRTHPASDNLLATWAQAPPWPPESVSHLIRRRLRQGDDPGPWIDALATQLVPDPTSRAWLVASWGRPRRPLDDALLAEVANAEGGRLVREPRFRAWLRGEWRAWARQKYRLVERQLREGPR